MTMVDIMSLVKSGGQVSLTVTPDDLCHFAEMLIAESRKEWEEQVASARKEEPEEKYLTAEEVRNYFGVTDATLWNCTAPIICAMSSSDARTCTQLLRSRLLPTRRL